jgi:integrase
VLILKDLAFSQNSLSTLKFSKKRALEVEKVEKKNKGSIITKNGNLYARIRFTDEAGKKRDIWKAAKSKKDAKEIIKALLETAESKTSQELDAINTTFNQLADFYEVTYLHEAIYVNDRKISGIRNIKPNQENLKSLRSHFGKRLIQSIQHSEIFQYKIKRLNTPRKFGGQRGIAGVNRELQLLRRILNIAVRQGWLIKNPFRNGDSLISLADEPQRTRILSFAEETRLFEAIGSNPLRFHLKGIVLIAVDMAFRRNEILTLRKKDIDLTNRIITIRAFNAKTAKSRSVGMTNRVYKWLSKFEHFKGDEKIFPIKTIHTTWGRTVRQAQIEDFHFHDLRATCISRLISAGLAPAEVMRISGHSTMACLYRYIRTDELSLIRAVNALDSYIASNSLSNEISNAVM